MPNGLVGDECDFNGGRAVGVGVLSNGFNGAGAEFAPADIDAEVVVEISDDFFLEVERDGLSVARRGGSCDLRRDEIRSCLSESGGINELIEDGKI